LTPDERDRMFALCEQIATEKDQHKFLQLIQELNDLLQRKEHRLKNNTASSKSGSARQKSA
jgi:hypothetical protein